MGFLDKVTKAVSDTVDRGKKEVDQFMRVQKVKGEITQVEEQVKSAGARAQQVKTEIGERVIVRLRDGSLVAPELLEMADRVAALEQEIAGYQATIAEKKAAIVAIENEGKPVGAPAAPPPPVPPPAAAPAAPQAAVPPPLPPAGPPPATAAAGPPPLPASSARTCPQCGKPTGEGDAFCTECGARL